MDKMNREKLQELIREQGLKDLADINQYVRNNP